LIADKRFTAVAVEADWPDAYDVRYVRGTGMAARAGASLAGFERFPTWMWRNTEVLDFVGWLRAHYDRTRASELKPVSMVSISTAFTARWPRCLPIWIR
jgi:erythromycin esterase-like protein